MVNPPANASHAVDAAENGLPAFDAEKYRKPLEDMNLTDEEVVEFLRTLNEILCTFVDIGFGIDSVQRIIPALAEFTPHEESDEIKQTTHS